MTLADSYARALHEARLSGGKPDALMNNLKAALKRRGHEKLLPRIAASYEKLAHREGKKIVTVRIARESDRAAAQKALNTIAPSANAQHTLDPSLISGFVISDADFRYDASGKRALLGLYQTLIATE